MPAPAPPHASPPAPHGLDEARLTAIARVVHEAMRAWQRGLGQTPAPPWRRAPRWMKISTQEAVLFRLKHPSAPLSAQHVQWMEEKRAAGWRKGPVKDAVKKTHPMMKPYDDLPEDERRKDALLAAVVTALAAPLA